MIDINVAYTLALSEIDAVMEKHFPEREWNVEWRSVLGQDYCENPIWSLTFYVETQDSRKEMEDEDD